LARDVEQLVLTLSADTRRMQRDLQRMTESLSRNTRRMEQEAARADRRLANIFDRMGQNAVESLKEGLRGAAPAVAAAFSTTAIIQMSDAYTRFTNALKVAGLEGANLAKVQDELFRVAQANGVELEPLAQLYQRVAQSSKDLGIRQEQIVKITESVAAAIRISGGSAESASGAILQLGQALGGAKVQAEEYNSLLDGLSPLLQAVANGNAKYGGSVAKLTADVKAGNVASKDFANAIIAASAALQEKAQAGPLTFAQSMTNLQQALIRFVGETDKSLGVMARLTAGLTTLTNNVELLIPSIQVLAVAFSGRLAVAAGTATAAFVANTVVSTRMAQAQIAAIAAISGVSRASLTATVAVSRLSGAMAFFGGPIGLAITAVAAALFLLAQRAKEAERANAELVETAGGAKPALDNYSKALDAVEQASGKAASKARSHAQAMREEAAAAVVAARALATKAAADAKERSTRASAALAEYEGRSDLSRGLGGAEIAGLEETRVGRAQTQAAAAARRAKAAADGAAAAERNLKDLNGQLDRLLKGQPRFAAPAASAAAAKSESKGGGSVAKIDKAAQEAERAAKELAEAFKRRQERLETTPYIEDVVAMRDFTPAKDPDLDISITPEEAGRSAGAIVDGMAEALKERREAFRQEFAWTFSQGIQAALDGDLKEFFSNWLRERAVVGLENALSKLADVIFDMNERNSSSGSGGFFSAALNAVGSIFGGGRANGGPITAGRAYLVGERGPEMIVPRTNGVVIPNLAGMGGRSRAVQPIVNVYLAGANGDMTIRMIAEDAARRGAAAAYAQAMRDTPARQAQFAALQG
jgi:tape measure domain-containing protein